MTDAQTPLIPPGYELVTHPDGQQEVRRAANSLLTKSISFRVTTDEQNSFIPFLESFPDHSWSTAFRWLLTQPDVKAVLQRKIEASVVRGME